MLKFIIFMLIIVINNFDTYSMTVMSKSPLPTQTFRLKYKVGSYINIE